MKLKKVVRVSEILEVWESFSGWYWYVTEYHEGNIAFGVVHGFETEWGYFSLDELRELEKQYKVWQVPEENWVLCPGVVKKRTPRPNQSGEESAGPESWEKPGGIPLALRNERGWGEDG